MTPNTPSEPSGSWDSIHVFEAAERGRQAHYKLTSTIMLQLVTHKGAENETGQQHAGAGAEAKKGEGWKKEGEVSLSGSMTRQVHYISCFCCGLPTSLIITLVIDRARLATSRFIVPHYQYREND